MYKLCKTKESAQRQREIEQTLLDLMQKKQYDEISVSEICEDADIPRKTFYRYFDGKEGVKQAILSHTMTDFEEYKQSSGIGKDGTLQEEFEEFFMFWKNKREVIEAFDKSGLIGVLIDSATVYAKNEFGYIAPYLSGSNVGEKTIAHHFVISGLLATMINWYRSDFAETVPNMARSAARIMTRPLFGNLTRTE